ncbi:hypothetical protein RD1_3846 [Roseobacter denitrificans OCh 114]|uniref:Uncharacterized protein n=1 Tax=Roseobacter denitrificans (strain ATCC 33942 / OCh 114) TaxID=375451 RepID=Q161N5_ROSDO|nr:hypothetical protein RD1_3846 [Roseobacter denitrificans OCh 114]
MQRTSSKSETLLKRHAKNLDHATLPETKDFNAVRDV